MTATEAETIIVADILVEAGAWPDEAVLEGLASRAAGAVFHELQLRVPRAAELSLVFTDDAHMRRLNGKWRGKDAPTNVLSFSAADIAPGDPMPAILGDIVLAHETITAEAALEQKEFDHHLVHLVAHGLLHLLGYDHETAAEADEMEDIERRALARLAIPDPYA